MESIETKSQESLSKKIEVLLRLQEVKQELDDLQAGTEILKKDAAVEERKYKSKQLQYEKFLPYIKKAEETFKNMQEEATQISDHIHKCEENKKKIKTIREFKALNKEIKDLEQRNIEIENDLLKRSEDLENKRERLQLLEEGLDEKKKTYKVKEDEFLEFEKSRNEDIKKCNAKKQKIEKGIDKKLLTLFNRIYSNKQGQSIILAEISDDNGVCQGCYTILPKQKIIDLRKKEDLIFCPFCSRILYLEE